LTPSEQRAARAERIRIEEAKPYGWAAYSEADAKHFYRLYREPHTKHLVCTCADFVFKGNAEPGYECKHVVAALKFIAREYLKNEYDPRKQPARAA
jgi:uncharacterized Zn finger protein